jgi:hypothetical protein
MDKVKLHKSQMVGKEGDGFKVLLDMEPETFPKRNTFKEKV